MRTYAAHNEDVEVADSESAADESLPAYQREGYRSFPCEGCEFLVAEDSEGRLNLSQTFVVDELSGELARAKLNGEIPSTSMFFNAAEWASEYDGDVLQGTEGKKWVWKVYLVAVASMDPYELDLEQVYVLEGAGKSLSKLVVERLAPPDTPKEEMRMRIREDGVVIDVATGLPGPEELHQAHLAGLSAMSELERDLALEAEAEQDELEEAVGEEELSTSSGEEGDVEEAEVIYDDENLRDFLVEVDDEGMEDEFDEVDQAEYDMPASDY